VQKSNECIKDLNMIPKAIKFLEGNIE
jgi:hypothetical protein